MKVKASILATVLCPACGHPMVNSTHVEEGELTVFVECNRVSCAEYGKLYHTPEVELVPVKVKVDTG